MSASSPHPGTVAVGDYELVRQRVAGEVAGRRRALRSSRPLLIGRADPRRSAHSVALAPGTGIRIRNAPIVIRKDAQ